MAVNCTLTAEFSEHLGLPRLWFSVTVATNQMQRKEEREKKVTIFIFRTYKYVKITRNALEFTVCLASKYFYSVMKLVVFITIKSFSPPAVSHLRFH